MECPRRASRQRRRRRGSQTRTARSGDQVGDYAGDARCDRRCCTQRRGQFRSHAWLPASGHGRLPVRIHVGAGAEPPRSRSVVRGARHEGSHQRGHASASARRSDSRAPLARSPRPIRCLWRLRRVFVAVDRGRRSRRQGCVPGAGRVLRTDAESRRRGAPDQDVPPDARQPPGRCVGLVQEPACGTSPLGHDGKSSRPSANAGLRVLATPGLHAAAAFGWEALVTLECTRRGLRADDYETGREPAIDQLSEEMYGDEHSESTKAAFLLLRDIRNTLAHGGPAKRQDSRAVLRDSDRLHAALGKSFRRLLQQETERTATPIQPGQGDIPT